MLAYKPQLEPLARAPGAFMVQSRGHLPSHLHAGPETTSSQALPRQRLETRPMLLDSLPPPDKRLRLTDTFTFSCYKGLACFGTCCRNRDLSLTPYDVLRLKNALSLHSDDFLARHTLYRLDPASGFPIISLRMGQDPERQCPFVTHEGCRVYDDRPTACRLFPLARASGTARDSAARDEFFYLLDTPGCLGAKEEKIQTLEEWLAGQGLGPYRTANDRMLDLLFHPDRERGKPLDERQLQRIIVACYNVDVFREFVFKTRFLESYYVDEKTRSAIEKDDAELLIVGFAYLRTSLFPEGG
jgi:Fe-S-cluster containining protein